MNICVFGASSDTIDSRYLAAGEELGRRMAQRGHSLIFGGGATEFRGRAFSGCGIGLRILRRHGLRLGFGAIANRGKRFLGEAVGWGL